MGLRRLARQLRAGRRKAALALGYAGYVEAAQAAGRAPMSKRAWRGEEGKRQKGKAEVWGDKNALSVEGCV